MFQFLLYAYLDHISCYEPVLIFYINRNRIPIKESVTNWLQILGCNIKIPKSFLSCKQIISSADLIGFYLCNSFYYRFYSLIKVSVCCPSILIKRQISFQKSVVNLLLNGSILCSLCHSVPINISNTFYIICIVDLFQVIGNINDYFFFS